VSSAAAVCGLSSPKIYLRQTISELGCCDNVIVNFMAFCIIKGIHSLIQCSLEHASE